MKNNAVSFFIGLIMLVAGLFWLTSVVQVSSTWGMGWRIGGVNVAGGFTLIPLIAGILWIFFNPKSLGAKILCGAGVVIIVASIVMSVRFYLHNTSLFVFLIIFVCIAGGAGLLARALLTNGHEKNNKQ